MGTDSYIACIWLKSVILGTPLVFAVALNDMAPFAADS